MNTTTLNRIQDERLAGGLAMLLVAAATAVANFAGSGENGGPAEYAVGLGVCAAVTALLFGRVLPNTADPARAAWILAAVGIASCLVFWSGLPFVFGVGAVYAASRAGRTGPAVLGSVAVVLGLIGCIIG
jgi:hypothetical protein